MEGMADEEFFMFIYNVEGEKAAEGAAVTDLLSQLQQVGEFSFKPGHCHAFFKALYRLTKIDLMIIIGVSVHDAKSEMEFCSGVLQREELIAGAERIRVNVVDAEKREAAAAIATGGDVPLDGIWFLQQATLFMQALDKVASASSKAVAMGYFE